MRTDKMKKYKDKGRLGQAEDEKPTKKAQEAFRHQAYQLDIGVVRREQDERIRASKAIS